MSGFQGQSPWPCLSAFPQHLSYCLSIRVLILKNMLNQSSQLDLAFQALADPTRRAMVERLSVGAASVGELARPLAMSLPAVMQHLAVLEGAGLVMSEKIGRVGPAGSHRGRWAGWRRGLGRGGPSGRGGWIGWAIISTRTRTEETAMAQVNDFATGVRPEPLVISRSFAAPRSLVFRAWSSAEHMRRWFCPEGFTVPHATVEFHEGGVCDICMRGAGWAELLVQGPLHRNRAAGAVGVYVEHARCGWFAGFHGAYDGDV